MQALVAAHELRSCDALAELLCGMCSLPRPPMSSALAGSFFTTEPTGKSPINFKYLPYHIWFLHVPSLFLDFCFIDL